ncbi:MAG: ADP-ribose pyrophosphatase [Berkelbacteria bacterium GW2011_GWA1_36_9]|uniref:ADP-ribose pyrophosphatase n=1 Tax=Berkelbacteria bacterium GW2011_GWA1_36_9 TaxID=1618331 RepID=A0A0G0FHR1_9BACT|nr:MAG: ADP-ribose pyrophosphatase [Berkelbacteria bacterium GW2011_GWA1_36_9]
MKANIDKKVIRELLDQAAEDGIQKIVVGAAIKRGDKFLLLERAPSDFMGGLVELPSGTPNAGEDVLQALVREVKEETDISVTAVVAYLGAFDYASSSGKKTRQFNFLVETEAGDIKLDQNEHSNYFLLNPSDEQFFKLNISNGTKSILLKAEEK